MFKRGQKKRARKRRLDRVQELTQKIPLKFLVEPLPESIVELDWSMIPPALDPAAEFTALDVRQDTIAGKDDQGRTRLKGDRGLRKRQQVESFLRVLAPMVQQMYKEKGRRVRVVEFCSGTGNATLALAWVLRPWATFVLVEKYPVAADICARRIEEAGLSRDVRAEAKLMEEYEEEHEDEKTDVVMAIHACGVLTDNALFLKCAPRRAAFLVCPCCVGKLKFAASEKGFHSAWLSQTLQLNDYLDLARCGDHSAYESQDSQVEEANAKRAAKMLLEQDRLAHMQEMGYEVHVSKIDPPDATPKNAILFGRWVGC